MGGGDSVGDLEFSLQVEGDPSCPPEELDAMVRAVMSELRAIPQIDVDRPDGAAAPAGSKSGLYELGSQILVAVSSGVVTAAMPPVIAAVSGWLRQQPSGTKIVVQHNNKTLELVGTIPVDAATLGPMIQKLLSAE